MNFSWPGVFRKIERSQSVPLSDKVEIHTATFQGYGYTRYIPLGNLRLARRRTPKHNHECYHIR